MALKALYGPQQAANLHWRRDRGPVRHLRNSERALEVSRYVSVSPRGRNRVTENLTTCCPDTFRGLVTAPRFDGAENGKQFMGRYVGNRATTQRRIGETQQPTIFLERDGR